MKTLQEDSEQETATKQHILAVQECIRHDRHRELRSRTLKRRERSSEEEPELRRKK